MRCYATAISLSKSVKAINYLRFHVKYFSINLIFGWWKRYAIIILCSARSCERSKTRFNEWTSGKEGRKEYRNRRFFRNYLILPPSSSPSCVYMYNHDIRAILYSRNILNSWPCLRPVFVSMHPIVPHYCIVALECLI